MNKVTVIGLTGQTAFLTTKHFPIPGETVSCTKLFFEHGGKGHNQAVACARMGVETHFIGAIGNDANGLECEKALKQEQIHTHMIVKKEQTAFATVTTEENGENIVEVYGGASAALIRSDFDNDNIDKLIQTSDYILLQNELPKECLVECIAKARECGTKVVYNPAPADGVSKDVLKMCDIITPNYGEAKKIAGFEERSNPTNQQFCCKFNDMGIKTVVITLGKKGMLLINENNYRQFPALKNCKAVDTTGAGDTFNGVMTAALSENRTMEEAVKLAIVASGISVTRCGAVGGIPTKEEVLKEYYKYDKETK